ETSLFIPERGTAMFTAEDVDCAEARGCIDAPVIIRNPFDVNTRHRRVPGMPMRQGTRTAVSTVWQRMLQDAASAFEREPPCVQQKRSLMMTVSVRTTKAPLRVQSALSAVKIPQRSTAYSSDEFAGKTGH
ncbi:MAG: hypothetical protein ACREKM_01130, partial [Longimicrobiales bacterium]